MLVGDRSLVSESKSTQKRQQNSNFSLQLDKQACAPTCAQIPHGEKNIKIQLCGFRNNSLQMTF